MIDVRVRLAAIAIGTALFAVLPTSVFTGLPSICLLKIMFGTECFGCGMVRAASCLAHGDVAGAADFNRLVFVVLPFLWGAATWDLVRLVKNRYTGR